jgi:mannose-1-phosphate guanylyltransferase
MALPPKAICERRAGGRNTAPAIAIAAHAVPRRRRRRTDARASRGPLVLQDLTAFQTSIRTAMPAAAEGKLVAFGIVARSPETGYGYIVSVPLHAGPVTPIVSASSKTRSRTRAAFTRLGRLILRNSGMFLFGARRFLDELARLAPGLGTPARAPRLRPLRDKDFLTVLTSSFCKLPQRPVDHAVMEKTQDAVMCRSTRAGTTSAPGLLCTTCSRMRTVT